MKFVNRIIDLGHLTYYFITSNRKAIFISMIGLSIALAVIAENWLLADSYKGEILKESGYFGMSTGDIRFRIQVKDSFSNIRPFLNLNSFSNIISESFEQNQYQEYLFSQHWHTKIDLKPTPVNDTDMEEYDQYISVRIPDNNFLGIIQDSLEGRIPIDSTELIIVKPKYSYERGPWWEPDWDRLFPSGVLGKQINVTAYPTENSINKPNNINLTIVGCLEYELIGGQQISFNDLVSEQIHKYFVEPDQGAPTFFITSLGFIETILEKINPINGSINVFPYIIGKCFLDYAKIDAFNIGSEIKKVERTISSFVKLLHGYITQGFDIQIDKEIIDRLNNFKEQFLMTQMLYQIFSTPLIAIALYLVFYSHNLVKGQKKTMIGMIKTRGGTRMQIILFLWGELAVGIIIAIFGGIIIGYLLTGIVRSTTDLLEFSGEIRYGSLKLVVVQDLITWGVILAICLHFLDILRTSKTSIQKSIEPIDKRPPLWNRYYLDIIASVVGLLGLLLINTLTSSELVDLPILNVLLPILIIPAPFLFFFGFIFFLSRFFPWLIGILANLLWRFSGGIKAFSLRSLVRHKHSANRAVIIITLALMYSIFSGTFIYYMDESDRIRNYNEMGAEILVRTKTSNHVTTGVQLQNVTGIASFSEIISCTLWQYPFPDFYFLFIDPDTFEETAFFVEKHCKLSSSLTDLMNRIRKNNSIIIHESQLDSYSGKKIGDSVNYPVDNGTNNITLSFVIQGTFRYWPRFFESSYFSESLENSLVAIGSLNLFNELNKSISFSSIYTNYYVKPESKTNLSQVINDIEDITGLEAFSPSIQHGYYLSSFFRRFLLSTLNSNILTCITISVVGITMFAFFTYIQRSKEIGVERAFGMTRTQIGTSFVIEGSALLLFSIIIGSGLGILYSIYIIELFHLSGGNIPKITFFPIIYFAKLIIGVILGAGIGTIVPAILASKKDISYILKND